MNMHLSNGTILKGSYKIIRFIAAGGFGCTYEAEHIMLGKHVAIKEFFIADFCNRDATTSQISVGVDSKKALVAKLKSKFIDEARAIARMSHPNIISVSDVFEDNGTAYYVMDYIDGKSLAHIVLERGRLSEQDSLKIIKTVSSALKYVHSQNRLHLDIKPANIMVRRDGNVFLIDFGVSKQYDEIDGQNTSTLMGYSSGYAPVEQMSNRVKNFTPATDIYALGATFYTLLTGIMPPVDSTDRADEDTLPPLPKTFSVSVRKAIEKSMAVSRSGRIQSIDEFLSILDNGAESIGTRQVSQKPTVNTPLAHNIKNEDGKISMVDLGLPSGIKWANMNIGAKRPEDYGDYYAWGETYTKKDFSKNGSRWFGSIARLMRFRGVLDSNNNLTSEYDAAFKQLGGRWRIPTKTEIFELIDNTTSAWTNLNGIQGCLVKSKVNNNSIFLPASGYFRNGELIGAGEEGEFWGSSFEDNGYSVKRIFIASSRRLHWTSGECYYGLPIRPVTK